MTQSTITIQVGCGRIKIGCNVSILLSPHIIANSIAYVQLEFWNDIRREHFLDKSGYFIGQEKQWIDRIETFYQLLDSECSRFL